MSRPEFTIEYLDPRSLSPSPGNFRRHPALQREALQQSLSEHGYLAAPICNRRTGMTILDGHARVELAAAGGEKLIPVRVVDVPPEQERRILASFDRIGALALQEDGALAALLEELAESEAGLPAGWGEEDLAGLREAIAAKGGLLPDADPDALPEAVETRCKSGDLWRLGEHRLCCDDCTRPEAVERLLSGERPQLMATDPPYGISLDSEWRDAAGKNSLGAAEPSYLRYGGRSTDTRADWSEAFALVPSLEAAYVWHAYAHSSEVLSGLLGIGFAVFQQIIWNKLVPAFTRTQYWIQHEPCWYVRRKNAPWYGCDGAETATVWDAPSPKHIMAGSKEERCDHPTQKPLDLWLKPIRNHTRTGEAIYEPFGGSGTAVIACEQQQRRCLCMEIEPRYCDVILARWEQATGRTAERLE